MEETEIRESFVFYKSFQDAIESLTDDTEKLLAYKTIIEYGFTGKEPDVSGVAKTIYLLTKPQIDANRKRYLNGKKGGRPKANEEANSNLIKTKLKPNYNVTYNDSYNPKYNDYEDEHF